MSLRAFATLLLEGLGDLVVGLITSADAHFVYDRFGIAPALRRLERKGDC